MFTKDKTKSVDPDLNGDWYLRPMPESTLPPAFRQGSLNLNSDGSKINYKKSLAGPWKIYWEQADAEEIVRLLTSSTIRPIHFREIPLDQIVTYVNPVCVEKLHDDRSLKFRTRLTTIGGDRIIYPYDKSAVTADLESFKILLNCMISENANWTTIDENANWTTIDLISGRISTSTIGSQTPTHASRPRLSPTTDIATY